MTMARCQQYATNMSTHDEDEQAYWDAQRAEVEAICAAEGHVPSVPSDVTRGMSESDVYCGRCGADQRPRCDWQMISDMAPEEILTNTDVYEIDGDYISCKRPATQKCNDPDLGELDFCAEHAAEQDGC